MKKGSRMVRRYLIISILLVCSIMIAGIQTNAVAAKYGDGMYLVGKDIPAGIYKVTLTDSLMKMGYLERLKGVSMTLGDIIANEIVMGDGYLEIKETDFAVRLQGVSISQVILSDLAPSTKAEVSDGVYLVGYDLCPGLYQVNVTDKIMNMGYVERLRGVSMEFGDIISNSIFQGPGYVEVKDGDFAIKVQGAKLQRQ